eukprot:gene17173-46304_t
MESLLPSAEAALSQLPSSVGEEAAQNKLTLAANIAF